MGRPGFGGRGGAGGAAATFGGVQSSTVNRNVDLLFMIDDSGSMALSQTKMVDALPAFMATLQGLRGGMPNLHVAVVSSDMGGAAGNSIPSCAGTGKGGKFQSLPRGACTTTNLQSGATFISDVDGVANYTGSMAEVLRCIAPLGEAGCDFEQPFAAITRALGADGLGQAPAENQGFLRSDANLAIVMLTNEDDCSPTAGVQLFDTSTNTLLASELGPPSSFRCNEFGHRCNGVAPSRLAPSGSVTDTVTYTNCVSAEGSGLLKTVSETAAQIKALKADPATQIFVAGIQAPTTPYQVHWKPALQTDTGPWPEITHSCLANDRTWANPSVRATEFVQEFGGHGLTLSFCQDQLRADDDAHRAGDRRATGSAVHHEDPRIRQRSAGLQGRRTHGQR